MVTNLNKRLVTSLTLFLLLFGIFKSNYLLVFSLLIFGPLSLIEFYNLTKKVSFNKNIGQKGKLSQILKLLITNLEKKNFFKPPEKRSSMIKNINNLFYRLETDDKELRILGSLIGSLSKNKKKLN